MRLGRWALAATLLMGCSLRAQVPTVKSLSGKYLFRELLLAADASQTASISGTLSFDGNGGFTFQGTEIAGARAPANASGTGTYSVNSSGSFVLSTDPLRVGTAISGRIGSGALEASNTENGATLFDMLIAIPAPARTVTNATLSGAYWVAALGIPAGSVASVRDSFFTATANSTGGFGDVAVNGEIAGAGYQMQTAPGSTYALNSDGSGSANFPAAASTDPSALLLAGTKSIFLSQDGSIFIGGGLTAGDHGMIVGIRAGASPPTASTVSGIYFGAGMNVTGSTISAFVGAANSTPASASMVWSRRFLESGNSKPLNVSTLNNYGFDSQGSGFMLNDQLATTSDGNFVLASGVQPFLSTGTFELILGVRAPVPSASGLFLNPLGVFNSATYAVGSPISEGELITVFGTGFASGTTVASKLPLPTALGGVQVLINGTAAPIYSVTSNQASAIVPYGLGGSTATVAVSSGGGRSNTVTVPVAATEPGVFTLTSNGLGSAAVLHPDYSVVSTDSPARHGEIVQIFLTGLGPVSPAVAAGAAAPANPLSLVTGPVAVFISGLPAKIVFQGLTPTLTALYQLNVVIPAAASAGSVPLAIETADGFTDQANIAIAPN